MPELSPLAATQQFCILHGLPLTAAARLLEARNRDARALARERTEQAERQHAAWQAMMDASRETFPVWKYTNPKDSRSRETHAAKDGLYFPATARFVDVRGTADEDRFNCRCVPIALTKWEWADLRARGAKLAGGYEEPVPPLPPSVFPRSVAAAASPPPSENYKEPMPPELAARTQSPRDVYFGSRKKLKGPLALPEGGDDAEPGIYVSEHPQIAADYAGPKGKVVILKLYVERPLDTTAPLPPAEAERIAAVFDKYPPLRGNAQALRQLAAAGNANPNDWFYALSAGLSPDASAEESRVAFRMAMAELGYDAVKHLDYDRPVLHYDGGTRYATNWLVFDPARIYSANPPRP